MRNSFLVDDIFGMRYVVLTGDGWRHSQVSGIHRRIGQRGLQTTALLMIRSRRRPGRSNFLPGFCFLPSSLALALEFVGSVLQIAKSLVGKCSFDRSVFLLFLQLCLEFIYVLNRPLQNRPLVLLAPWDNLCELINPFINGFSASSLDY